MPKYFCSVPQYSTTLYDHSSLEIRNTHNYIYIYIYILEIYMTFTNWTATKQNIKNALSVKTKDLQHNTQPPVNMI
jgi:hypothetical protein